jgi:hypothetical protein
MNLITAAQNELSGAHWRSRGGSIRLGVPS